MNICADAGQVVETGTPSELLDRKESLFYAMCADSGELDVIRCLGSGFRRVNSAG